MRPARPGWTSRANLPVAEKGANAMTEGKLSVKLYVSSIGTKPKQRATLKAMGLYKVGDTAELPDNPCVRGMIARVKHLLAPAPDRKHKKPHFGARPSHRRPE